MYSNSALCCVDVKTSKSFWNKARDWFKTLWIKEEPVKLAEIPKIVRNKVDTPAIRARMKTQGWRLLEIPIKKNSPIPEERLVVRWKVVATKGDKSVEAGGATVDEAISNVGKFLGVIPR